VTERIDELLPLDAISRSLVASMLQARLPRRAGMLRITSTIAAATLALGF
jgi:hypothetical protein